MMNHSEDESARKVSQLKGGRFDFLVLEVLVYLPGGPEVEY